MTSTAIKLPVDSPAVRVRLSARQYGRLRVLARQENMEPEFFFNKQAARLIGAVLGIGDDLSIKEAGAEIGVHPNTIKNQLKAGGLPGAYRVGRAIRIPRADLDSLRERNRAVALA